jgi:SpoVK/Ycf46/Vps4 family AAA+-type ATPase
LEVIDTTSGIDTVAGLENVKSYLKDVLEAIKRGEKEKVPMGIMLLGPPGTGKTSLATALAFEASFNCVRVKNIFSPYLGQSESRMEEMLSTIRSLAPVVVIRDEIDQEESVRGAMSMDDAASKTESRIRKKWFEFLSDPNIRGQVLVVACSNRPDRIDAAMLRSGRFDVRIPVLMPDRSERAAIFREVFRRHHLQTGTLDFEELADLASNRSGADLEVIVLEANRLASGQNGVVSQQDVITAINNIRSSVDQRTIDQMTWAALDRCSNRGLYPQNYEEILQGIQNRRLVDLSS